MTFTQAKINRLIELHNKDYTAKEMAEELQEPLSTVNYHRDRLGLKAKRGLTRKQRDLMPQALEMWLVDIPPKQIANKLGVDLSTIMTWAKRNNWPPQTHTLNPVFNGGSPVKYPMPSREIMDEAVAATLRWNKTRKKNTTSPARVREFLQDRLGTLASTQTVGRWMSHYELRDSDYLNPISPEQAERVVQLYVGDGRTQTAIAKIEGIALNTVGQILREAGVETSRSYQERLTETERTAKSEALRQGQVRRQERDWKPTRWCPCGKFLGKQKEHGWSDYCDDDCKKQYSPYGRAGEMVEYVCQNPSCPREGVPFERPWYWAGEGKYCSGECVPSGFGRYKEFVVDGEKFIGGYEFRFIAQCWRLNVDWRKYNRQVDGTVWHTKESGKEGSYGPDFVVNYPLALEGDTEFSVETKGLADFPQRLKWRAFRNEKHLLTLDKVSIREFELSPTKKFLLERLRLQREAYSQGLHDDVSVRQMLRELTEPGHTRSYPEGVPDHGTLERSKNFWDDKA